MNTMTSPMNTLAQTHTPLDVIGIGAGPANLSLAALAQPTSLTTGFVEKQSDYAWHKGLLLPEARMQTSYLKDLVTCVDPTNSLSFLNFLVEQRRLYPFLASGQSTITRHEFSQYLNWAIKQLPEVSLGETVKDISFQSPYFTVTTNKRRLKSRYLTAGTGMQPYIPDCAKLHESEQCFHASQMNRYLRSGLLHNKRIAIIGGGQTGADVFQALFSNKYGQPSEIHWVSRRANLEALDEGVFTDEYFMPQYVEYFHHLPDEVKRHEIQRQKLTSDGITSECLQQLYQTLYFDRFISEGESRWHIHCHHELRDIAADLSGDFRLKSTHQLTQAPLEFNADIIILCTGYERRWPKCLLPLLEQAKRSDTGGLLLADNYALQPTSNDANQEALSKIFMLNAGMESHGIADPQLSLISWRAAKIINSICERNVYSLEQSSLLSWNSPVINTKTENAKIQPMIHPGYPEKRSEHQIHAR